MVHAAPLTPKYGTLLAPREANGPVPYAVDHVVTHGETSVLGPVYYMRLFEWQGRLRELFSLDLLTDYMKLLDDRRVLMVTVSAACEYLATIHAGDRVSQQMTVPWLRGSRAMGEYAFYRTTADGQELVARGEQMWTNTDSLFNPAPWPGSVLGILRHMNTNISQPFTA